jgi:hypothetical protein
MAGFEVSDRREGASVAPSSWPSPGLEEGRTAIPKYALRLLILLRTEHILDGQLAAFLLGRNCGFCLSVEVALAQ